MTITATPANNYAFVLNVWHLVGADAFELAPGHTLRRATQQERAVIRDVMARIPGGFFPHGRAVWQIQWPHAGGELVPLPEDEWRYFVIAFEGFNDTLSQIQEAFDIAPLELEVGFTMIAPSTITYYPARFFHVLQDVSPAQTDFFVDVTADDVSKVRVLRQKLEAHDHTVLDLRRFIQQLRSLKALPLTSPLRFLGYFAVLEALLTHQPKPSDPYDSITRQVKQKIALLDNRWTPRLDYSLFGGAAPAKIWTAMYACRSKFAHGAPVDFLSTDLRVLGNQKRAFALLIDTVKAIMRYVLDEPRLLTDLRDC